MELKPNDYWQTPQKLFDRLDYLYNFEVDLAANASNAKKPLWLGEDCDSLQEPWHEIKNSWLFLNPPFSQLPMFSAKAAQECHAGAAIVMLCPAHRVEQAWYHEHVIPVASKILIPRGRVNYDPPPGMSGSSCRFPSQAIEYNPLTIGQGLKVVSL